ncbi:MAG: hypothetical protein ACO3LE_07415 [Bdellovibrionota bacterium]
MSFSLTLFADESPSLCSVGLAAIALPTNAERTVFETKPKASKPKYKLGLLVGLESGSKILGLGHYLSGHESIKREIENRYGDIDEYFWGGEILMLLSMEYPNGYFTKINETCGLINDLQKNSPQNGHEPSKLNNSSQFLERALNGSCSHYHNGHHVPEFLNWSRERPQHLHPKLADSDVNLRHSILNSLFIIRSFGIDFLFRYPLHPEARKTILLLEKLLDLFDENDFDAELMTFLRDAHQVILRQESLNLRESLQLEKIYAALEKKFLEFDRSFESTVVDVALTLK